MTLANSVSNFRTPGLGWLALAALGGVAVQLQQADLWGRPDYLGLLAACLAVALAHVWLAHVLRRSGRLGLVQGGQWAQRRHFVGAALAQRIGAILRSAALLLACAGAAFALVGLRASHFDAQRLDPALDGQDLQVMGVVRDLTHSNATGLRFRLQVESAQRGAQAVQLPPRMDVGWYSGLAPRGAAAELADWELQRQPQDLRPGQRWQFTLRVKAPHGSRNPQGFDYALALDSGRASHRLCARRGA
jgi:competence protein ComEC